MHNFPFTPPTCTFAPNMPQPGHSFTIPHPTPIALIDILNVNLVPVSTLNLNFRSPARLRPHPTKDRVNSPMSTGSLLKLSGQCVDAAEPIQQLGLKRSPALMPINIVSVDEGYRIHYLHVSRSFIPKKFKNLSCHLNIVKVQ